MAVEYMNKKVLKGAWAALGQIFSPFSLWIFLEASHFFIFFFIF